MFQFFLMWASEPPTVTSGPFGDNPSKTKNSRSLRVVVTNEKECRKHRHIYQTIVLPVQLVLNKETKDPLTLNE